MSKARKISCGIWYGSIFGNRVKFISVKFLGTRMAKGFGDLYLIVMNSNTSNACFASLRKVDFRPGHVNNFPRMIKNHDHTPTFLVSVQ